MQFFLFNFNYLKGRFVEITMSPLYILILSENAVYEQSDTGVQRYNAQYIHHDTQTDKSIPDTLITAIYALYRNMLC